ncbi:ATP-binding protein [Burkholderia gladioli]|uniref:ATP-binding protein n=1 Tax=Burkholderia gladioli TaxID=28095 RepID=UPI003B501BD9
MGLGLGLHIVEKIAQMHRGTVKVVTDEADHTTFRIELPRSDERDETASRG